MPSFEEAKMIAGRDEPGDVADFFLGYGIEVVALKMGERGCFVRTAGEEISLPAHSVEVVDATGAGDSFAAGFLAGVALGWGLGRTTRLANAAGATCITSYGGDHGD
ncbi:MAG: carbohydrate kinase family protein [Anaerolineae bacterium]